MNFTHTIVAVNRPDLLAHAVESVRPIWRHVAILDNSPGGHIGREVRWPVPVLRPSVPLSCAQSMNFLQRLALERGAEAWGYQHEDAEAGDGTAERYLAAAMEAIGSDRRWCTVLTSYDWISAYRTSAVSDIGEWDWMFPNPNYHIDCDWFYRAKLKGYECIETGLPVAHLDGGSVTKRGTERYRSHANTFPFNDFYYTAKWGGRQHYERFKMPWGDD